MCGRFFVVGEGENELLSRMINEAAQRQMALTGESNIAQGEVFPSATVAALAVGRSGDIGVFPMQWGFHRPDRKGLIINTRSESALEKPMFRQSMLERRCLIPCSWYFEWETRDAQQGLLNDAQQSLMNDSQQGPLSDDRQGLLSDTQQSLLHDAQKSLLSDAQQGLLNDTQLNLLSDAQQSLLNDVQQSLLNDHPSFQFQSNSLSPKSREKISPKSRARNTQKIKYAIRPNTQGIVYLAGIYRYEEAQKLPVLSILTREPAPEISFIHDRMPVIFSDRTHGAWLDKLADPQLVLDLCEKSMTYKTA